jgi:hypothetical protein
MDRLEVTWSELFGDEDVDVGFDPTRRGEPPWFGFIPRVLGVDLVRPFQPTLALWSRGRVVEVATFTVDRRQFPGTARALLRLAESFADACRDRNLFGAYLATFDLWGDAACAAATAAVIREADWCGMFVLDPTEYVREAGVEPAALLAEAAANRLEAGTTQPPELVARRRAAALVPKKSDLPLESALVAVDQRRGEFEEDELDEARPELETRAPGRGDDE